MKIVSIGAGNVATHLCKILKKSGQEILQIYSRTEKSAKELADKIKCDYAIDLKEINKEADIYIFSISDNAILQVLEKINIENKFFVHTAGSISMDIFKEKTNNFGVFYPFQTFSKNKEISFAEIPIFIEANTKENEISLKKIASKITKIQRVVNSEERKYLHLTAVFACNFVNSMYAVAEEILIENNLDFDFLLPLIKETAEKASQNSPLKVQTGPAVRNDKNVIDKHLKLLSHLPKYKKLYSFVSEIILQQRSKT